MQFEFDVLSNRIPQHLRIAKFDTWLCEDDGRNCNCNPESLTEMMNTLAREVLLHVIAVAPNKLNVKYYVAHKNGLEVAFADCDLQS